MTEKPGSDDATVLADRVPGLWRFGRYALDEATGRLLDGKTWHTLDHGSLEVLRCLLRQGGTTVGKDRLLAAGWPGRVVSENSLTKAISRLRQVLDDHEGALLCTVHGYGYRLASRVEWTPAPPLDASTNAAPAPAAAPASARPVAATRSPRVWRAALAAMTLAGLVLVAWHPWRSDPGTAAASETAPTPGAAVAEGASIAVLPFTDLSEGRDQAYFSDGLADELLDRLAQLPQLRVASRTSSFALRDSKSGVEEIGRRLGVSTVLEGSVRRNGGRVRITVQLINARDGFHLWSRTYDKRMTDLFAVQDDIARSVVSALQLQLLPAQANAVTRHRTSSQAAYDAYMLGQHLMAVGGADNQRRAIMEFERAIGLDPQFSTAYAALANLLGGDVAWADSPAQVAAAKQRSLEMIDKAVALEPDRPQLYLARADFLYYTRHDYAAAQRDLDVAARLLRRRTPEVVVLQTRLLAVLGRIDEAIALERAAVQEDPNSTWAWGHLGYHLAMQGQYEEAHRALARAIELRPDDDHVTYYEGVAWLLEGKPAQASAAFERSGSVFRLSGLAASRHDEGDRAASDAALQALVQRFAAMGAYQVAQAHAWRGEADQAFAWLERAKLQNDAGLATMKADPMMRPLHGDPRYRRWLAALRLDEAALARR